MTKCDKQSAMPMRLQRKNLRALACASLCIAALSACAIIGGKQADPLTVYAPNVHADANNDWPRASWSLAIAPPTAPRMLDSARILVRPTADELQVYRGAAWSQPAPQLLEEAVLGALEDSGKIGAVARQSSGIRANCKLTLDIRHFEAQYANGPDAPPQAWIEVSAKLIGNNDQNVIASRSFVRTQAATSKEIPDVAAAFEQALDAVTADVAGWTLRNGK